MALDDDRGKGGDDAQKKAKSDRLSYFPRNVLTGCQNTFCRKLFFGNLGFKLALILFITRTAPPLSVLKSPMIITES